MATINAMSEGRHLSLLGAPDGDIGNPKPPARTGQAMQIELARETVKEMQRFAKSGKGTIQISFGKTPILRFGTTIKSLHVAPPNFRTEIYKTEDKDKNHLHFEALVSHTIALKKVEQITSGSDSAMAKLQATMETLRKEKEDNKATFIDEVKDPKKMIDATKKGGAGLFLMKKSGQLSTNVTPRRSLPASPALNPSDKSQVASTPITYNSHSASRTACRFVLVHFLAVAPAKAPKILEVTRFPEQDWTYVQKIATLSPRTKEWVLSDQYYKELDVWQFGYTKDDRESAIDNAVRAFDRLRVSRDDYLWQLLLPKEERNKGKVLSKLVLGSGRPSTPKPDTLNHRSLLAGAGGEPMGRTKSLESMEGKKNDARTKRLLSNKPSKPIARAEVKNDDSKKTTAHSDKESVGAKTSQKLGGSVRAGTKSVTASAGQNRKIDTKFKSAERVEDSDDDEELNKSSLTPAATKSTEAGKRDGLLSTPEKMSTAAKSHETSTSGAVQPRKKPEAPAKVPSVDGSKQAPTHVGKVKPPAVHAQTRPVTASPSLGGLRKNPMSTQQTTTKPRSNLMHSNESKDTKVNKVANASTDNASKSSNESAQFHKRAGSTTNSSTTSWVSSVSGKSTPMHRQSSSQSSTTSIPASTMPPILRKRPADTSADRTLQPAKKLKTVTKAVPPPSKTSRRASSSLPTNTSDLPIVSTPVDPAKKVKTITKAFSPLPNTSRRASSSPLTNASDLQSVSTPSAESGSGRASPGSDRRQTQTASRLPVQSAEEVLHENEGNAKNPRLESLKEQHRRSFSAWIKQRMELEAMQPNVTMDKKHEAWAAFDRVEFLKHEIEKLGAAEGDYMWTSGVPKGFKLDEESEVDIRKKLDAVTGSYTKLREEAVAMETVPVETNKELDKQYGEVLELRQLLYPGM